MTFSVHAAREFAAHHLSVAPKLPWIERAEPRGELVKQFFLPLELCMPLNRLARPGTQAQPWMLHKLRRSAYMMMRAQNNGRIEPMPLRGRPQLRCVRFSSRPADAESGWSKNPIDRLKVDRLGLGYITDDGPQYVRTDAWWEPSPAKAGFVLIEIRSG